MPEGLKGHTHYMARYHIAENNDTAEIVIGGLTLGFIGENEDGTGKVPTLPDMPVVPTTPPAGT
jgi:hypothetical protein